MKIEEKAVQIRNEEISKISESIRHSVTLRGLNRKQRAFCMHYLGSGSSLRAAEAAGYKYDTRSNAHKWSSLRRVVSKLMSNKQVRDNIDIMNRIIDESGIASSTRIRVFWTDIMEDDSLAVKMRLEASKLLSQCYPEFNQHVILEQRESKRLDVNISFKHLPVGALGRSLGLGSPQPLIEAETVDTESLEDLF